MDDNRSFTGGGDAWQCENMSAADGAYGGLAAMGGSWARGLAVIRQRDAAAAGAASASPTDEALMARVVLRDATAFATLAERHARRMLALAQSVLGSRADADDVVQEAFLRLWLHAARWDPARAALATWLHRIVVNLCLDRLRKPRAAPLEEWVLEVADPSASALDQMAAQQAAERVRAALARLPPRQRLALALFYFQDLDLRAGAAAMELSAGAFEALLRRARASLKTIMSPTTDREMPP